MSRKRVKGVGMGERCHGKSIFQHRNPFNFEFISQDMYFVYLDESGDSRFRENIREEDDFFILGGFMIREKDLLEANEKFKKFKKDNLPEDLWDYPLHAVELNQISKHKKTEYKGKLSDEQGRELLTKAYQIISTLPIEAIVIIIDKYELKKKYKTPTNPYHLAYEILCEKIQKIIEKRNEENNKFALVNLAECCFNLTNQLTELHCQFKKDGTTYAKWNNLLQIINIESNKNSVLYDVADLICYAFRRHYYGWLCEHLGSISERD